MKRIQGYICIASPRKEYDTRSHILFGKNTGHSNPPYQNLESNNLTPYPTLSEAEKGKRQLLSRPAFVSVRIARLAMQVAEQEEDLEQMVAGPFVVIETGEEPGERLLYGPRIEDKPGFDTRAPLVDNGLTPFRTFDAAKWACSEVSRQLQCPATVATFKLTYLKKRA